ncbi:MAG: hypothetical protein PHF83_01800 [Candidatus Methanomethylophilus sp.]|nr:hypothetical protein [Methanomethylophilus sp.]
MIKFPPLKISKRDREFRLYSRVQRAAVVRAYLFKGYSNRQLDGEILGLDCDETNGYQSMGILHHYGLTESYKGFLKDIAPADVLSLIPDECSFDFLYDILEDESDAEVLPEEVVSDSQIGTDKTVLCKIRQNQDFFRERECLKHTVARVA